MACKPFSLLQCQREGSPGEGANWTTDDGVSAPQTTWMFRGRFLVGMIGDDCTGWMHFEYSLNGGDWTEFGYTKYAKAGLLRWYKHPNTITGNHVEWRHRTRLEYDGYEWFSDIVTITTSGEGREGVDAELLANAEAAALAARSQDADMSGMAKTAGVASRTQIDASISAATQTAGFALNDEEVTANAREQTAGLAARSVTAELLGHSTTAGAPPREAEATAANRSQSAGAV